MCVVNDEILRSDGKKEKKLGMFVRKQEIVGERKGNIRKLGLKKKISGRNDAVEGCRGYEKKH